MAYDNTNSGFIGKNQNKTEEKHPDLKGSINIEGVEYWLSAWKNSKGYGMKFTKKDDKPQQAPQQGYRKPSQDGAKARQLPPQRNSGGFEDMDDCPF
jgi:hypothetical protein